MALVAFNMKDRLFLGDGGVYAIGLFAIIVYHTLGTHTLRAASTDELVLMLGLPVANTSRLTYKRFRQRRPSVSVDRDNLHGHPQA